MIFLPTAPPSEPPFMNQHHDIPHNTASDFIANELQQWTYAQLIIHDFHHIYHCPEATGLTEMLNSLLTTQL